MNGQNLDSFHVVVDESEPIEVEAAEEFGYDSEDDPSKKAEPARHI